MSDPALGAILVVMIIGTALVLATARTFIRITADLAAQRKIAHDNLMIQMRLLVIALNEISGSTCDVVNIAHDVKRLQMEDGTEAIRVWIENDGEEQGRP